jgi:predicted RND superfamily exporter protein
MVFALVATPAVLILVGERENHKHSRRALDRLLLRTGNTLYGNRLWAVVAILILMSFSALGMLYVELQDSWINNFKKSSVVYADDQALNRKLAGTNVTYVELDTGRPNGIKNPAFLRKLQKFHDYLKTVDGLGSSLSLVQIIEKMNLELEGISEIPDSPEAVAQYLLLLDGSTYDRFWDHDYQKVLIAVFGKRADYQYGRYYYSNMDLFLEKHFPECIRSYGGDLRLSYHWVGLLQNDQIKSFLTALLLILFVSTGVFWSFKKGAIVVSPIVLAVAMNYGIMGFCGIYLSVAVSVFSAITLGVGVDYAIHLKSKYDVLSLKMPSSEVLPAAFTSAGKAIVSNACVVIGGFLTLLLSQTPPLQKLGLICSLGIVTSLVAVFLVVPVLSIKK